MFDPDYSLELAFSTGSHCLIEWDEPNNPASVVERMLFRLVGSVSERCAQLGAVSGGSGSSTLSQGSKREMELQMLRLDDPESDSEDDECAQAEKDVEKQTVS